MNNLHNNKSILFKRWQSLRIYNIAILCAFVIFYLIGTLQSYTLFSTPAVFNLPLIMPTAAIFLCAYLIKALVNKQDQLSMRLIPLITLFTTLFITINSHFETATSQNSFLYFTLLLPLFYAYILSYNFKLLVINNIVVILSYSFTAVVGETSMLVFTFNLLFLSVLIFLTIYSHIKNNRATANRNTIQTIPQEALEAHHALYLKTIIHDIRQPLTSLSLYSELLGNKESDPQQKLVIENLRSASTQLDHWLSSLLELAALDANSVKANIKNVALEKCLSKVIKKQSLIASSQGMKLKVRLHNSVLKTDAKLLSEIIDNLLSNALIHGSQKQGEVILLTAHQQDKSSVIQVWNRGKGIHEEQLKALFDEHYYANNSQHNKAKGIGLGLALSQRKAKLLKSKISVKTSTNGSCFSIKIAQGSNTETAPAKPSLRQENNAHILLIDDDESILSALSMLLQNWGYSVDCAVNSEQALQFLETSSFALIISDYQLPGNTNGIGLIKLAQQKHNIPALLLTGDIDPDKLKEGESRSYKILHKPIKPPVLRLLLRRLLIEESTE